MSIWRERILVAHSSGAYSAPIKWAHRRSRTATLSERRSFAQVPANSHVAPLCVTHQAVERSSISHFLKTIYLPTHLDNPSTISHPENSPHIVRYTESSDALLRLFSRIWTMAKKPFEDSRLAKYLDQRILELKPKKNQSEFAAEAGFAKPRKPGPSRPLLWSQRNNPGRKEAH